MDFVLSPKANWCLTMLDLAALGDDSNGDPVSRYGNIVPLLTRQQTDDRVELRGRKVISPTKVVLKLIIWDSTRSICTLDCQLSRDD